MRRTFSSANMDAYLELEDVPMNKDAEHFMEAPCNAEAHVRARILGLLEYINRIQVK